MVGGSFFAMGLCLLCDGVGTKAPMQVRGRYRYRSVCCPVYYLRLTWGMGSGPWYGFEVLSFKQPVYTRRIVSLKWPPGSDLMVWLLLLPKALCKATCQASDLTFCFLL